MNETLPQEITQKKIQRFRLGKKGRIAAGALAAVLLAAYILPQFGKSAAAGAAYRAVQPVRQTIQLAVSGTATLEPADSYNVTTLITGSILDAPFETGDSVSRDDLLYTMDNSDAQQSVARAGLSLEQAQLGYQQAVAVRTPTATLSGTINEVMVHDGAMVNPGDALCTIVASSDLTADFLFSYASPDDFYAGQSATVFIGDFDGSVQGTVKSVSSGSAVTSTGRETCTVRVTIPNPGIIVRNCTASAVIGNYCSYGKATITMPASATVYADGSGMVSGFSKLAGSTVTRGEALCTIESQSIQDGIRLAQLSLESARLSASSAAETLDDYNIKSPIAGTVIEKNFKAGDKVDGVSSGTLAVIYDLSYLKMKMNVDEMNIGRVQVGQTVELSASALPGKTFTGRVETVSINGSTTGGFTTYPVTIIVENYGDLRPGMNVSARIIGQTVENALCVPVEAVGRGNTVLVALPGALAEDGVTVADPEKTETRPVEPGSSDSTYIEILSGLAEDETVLIQNQTNSGMVTGG